MSEPKLRTQSTFPAVLTIDGVDLAVRVKRMTNTEYDDFAGGFSRWVGTPGSQEEAGAKASRETAARTWTREALDAYLSLVPGELEHDGREITKGGDLLDIYGGRDDVVPQALTVVILENRLKASQKKTYKSQLDLQLGLRSAPLKEGTGNALAPTAEGAAPSVSVPAAAAMDAPSPASSGMTDLSC